MQYAIYGRKKKANTYKAKHPQLIQPFVPDFERNQGKKEIHHSRSTDCRQVSKAEPWYQYRNHIGNHKTNPSYTKAEYRRQQTKRIHRSVNNSAMSKRIEQTVAVIATVTNAPLTQIKE